MPDDWHRKPGQDSGETSEPVPPTLCPAYTAAAAAGTSATAAGTEATAAATILAAARLSTRHRHRQLAILAPWIVDGRCDQSSSAWGSDDLRGTVLVHADLDIALLGHDLLVVRVAHTPEQGDGRGGRRRGEYPPMGAQRSRCPNLAIPSRCASPCKRQ